MDDEDEFELEIGTEIDLGPGYPGPDGYVTVIVDEDIPPEVIVFIKDGKVVGFLSSEDSQDDIPKAGSYDALLCHPDSGPVKKMGTEWTKDASYKKN